MLSCWIPAAILSAETNLAHVVQIGLKLLQLATLLGVPTAPLSAQRQVSDRLKQVTLCRVLNDVCQQERLAVRLVMFCRFPNSTAFSKQQGKLDSLQQGQSNLAKLQTPTRSLHLGPHMGSNC